MQSVNLNASVAYPLKLLKCGGLWTYPQEKFYKFYKLFIIIIMAIFNMTITSFVVFNIREYIEISTVLAVLPNTWIALVKNLIFRYKFEEIAELLGYLKHTRFQAKNQQHATIVMDSIELSKRTFLSFFIVGTTCLILFIVVPVLYHNLPFPAFDYQRNNYYELFYFIHSIGISFVACNNIATDTFFAVNMIQIGTQFDLLHHDIIGMVDDKQYLKKSLIDLIEHHRTIIDYAKQLLRVFNGIILLQFICSVIVICMTTFVLSVLPPSDPAFLRLFAYEIVIFVQILLYCWFGHEITVKSDTLSYACFETEWIEMPQQFKKDLLFFMVAIKKPMVLIILDLIPVNIITFTGIARSAFAYFSALRNLRQSNEE